MSKHSSQRQPAAASGSRDDCISNLIFALPSGSCAACSKHCSSAATMSTAFFPMLYLLEFCAFAHSNRLCQPQSYIRRQRGGPEDKRLAENRTFYLCIQSAYLRTIYGICLSNARQCAAVLIAMLGARKMYHVCLRSRFSAHAKYTAECAHNK